MGEVCRVICNSEVSVDEKFLRGTRVGLSAYSTGDEDSKYI